jgi:hypothetical protein
MTRPVIAMMNGTGNGLLRLAGFRPAGGEAMVHSVEELELLAADLKRLATAKNFSPVRFVERSRNTDSRLHDLVASSCGNRFLANELNRLKTLFRAFRDVSLRQKNYDRAEQASRFEMRHISNSLLLVALPDNGAGARGFQRRTCQSSRRVGVLARSKVFAGSDRPATNIGRRGATISSPQFRTKFAQFIG